MRALSVRRSVSALATASFAAFASVGVLTAVLTAPAHAQAFGFTNVEIEGNQRVEAGTILTYAAIAPNQSLSAGEVNAALQRVLGSGLFESVDFIPRGSTLVIQVVEYPTISVVAFEGNRRLKDEALGGIVTSAPRRIYSPTQAEADAEAITEAYRVSGRLSASVTPKIIRRSNNRVDLVFEIAEGRVVETERVSFVGNRDYSDRRLRRVVASKQAGLLRQLIQSDTFIADRIEFDRQILTDFYNSRGYIDFQVLDVTAEVSRERDASFVTFTVQEGQSFDIGEVTVTTDLDTVDPDEFLSETRMRTGQTYNPAAVERDITRLELLATQKALNFIRVEPRVTRNDEDLTLDIEFAIVRGDRVFVERIDIEGNATTLDRVIRRQFRTVEGDPFNPREIRAAAERIRALDFFENVEVGATPGSAQDQVVIDVDVAEKPTGSLGFGANFSSDSGLGIAASFSERNFLGRGQSINVTIDGSDSNRQYALAFTEPALLGRDLTAGFDLSYRETNNDASAYDTTTILFRPRIAFPLGENSLLGLRYTISSNEIANVDPLSSAILASEIGTTVTSAVGYTYSYDTRRSGLDPTSGVLLEFSQDYAGLGGDAQYVKTQVRAIAQRLVAREEVTLRATFEAGAVNGVGGYQTRVIDRYNLRSSQLRGFESFSVGPQDSAALNQDTLGGNYFAVARFDAEFPLGLPEEYGITGGVFFDIGSVWGLDNKAGGPQGGPVTTVDDSLKIRSSLGFSILWDSQLGPLRFNFSRPVQSEPGDRTRGFDFAISTSF